MGESMVPRVLSELRHGALSPFSAPSQPSHCKGFVELFKPG